jgi:serine/threonine protein kinase/tetratricopeptide (TPR) repeat protein
MPLFEAERNKLFGMLAFRAGLIDQTALVSAFHTCTGTQEKSLVDVLHEQGSLDAEGAALIQALAAKHLGANGDDPEKTLDSLAASDSTREILSQLGFATLNAGLAPADPDSTIGGAGGQRQPPGPVLKAGSERFRLLRPHAQGGLGAVFVALDTELNREVALKQILDRHADDLTSRSRFLLEAEITGGLQHPGIVPVYGLGIHGNGRPYYAMRFIRGDSLKEAIDRFHERTAAESPTGPPSRPVPLGKTEKGAKRPGAAGPAPGSRDLALRKLLLRFLDVCNAIDYAHSRGVLHRDLKPANIILGEHGETLVVDWGLAKVTGKGDPAAGERTMTPRSGGGSAETLPGSAMGTPAFMSPEQARGEIDQLGPPSDVYSLGATLYCLLTGKSPVQSDDVGSIIRAVRRGEFLSPRQVDPSVCRTLEAVCKKAMALEPGDRYASPRALADDIERWMADEPVSALPDRWGARLARWSRRHRSATRAAGASLVVIATVATLAALAIGREQAQTRGALKAETLARQSESKARELAQEQSQLALDAIREYNTGVTREFLLEQPEMESLRKSLLQAPIRFYRRLAQNIERNGINDPAARGRLAQAQLDLGEIINEIGTVDDSITNFEQARENIEQVVRDLPGVAEYRFLLARTRCFLANRYDKASRPGDARAAFDQAIADFEHLARAHPTDRQYRANQAESLQLRADFLWDHGDLDGSRRDYLASIAIGAALIAEFPDDVDVMDKHASSLNNLSILFGEAGQWSKRMDTLAESTALRERLVAATPADDPRRQRFLSNLGSCYGNMGSGHLDDGALDEAVNWIKKALAIQDEQIKNRPNSVDYLERVGANHTVLGQLEFRTGHLAIARTELDRSRGYLERLLHVRPGDSVFGMHLVICLGSLADVESESGATILALNLTRRAAIEAEEILRKNPKFHPAAQGLARELVSDAELSWEIGDSARSLANLDRAEAFLRTLVASQPEVPDHRALLATTIRVRVRMEREIGRDHEDEGRLREALDLTESALRADPELVMNVPSTASVYSDLATTLGRRGQAAEARALFGRALDRLDQAQTGSPRDVRIRRTLAQSLAARAEFWARSGQLRESLADWDRALALAAETDVLALRLGRATTALLSNDYRAALAEAGAVDRSIDDRDNLRLASVVAHAQLSSAIRRDQSLTPDARALGVATELAAALDQIGRARRSPAYRDPRRLYHRLRDHDFDPLRELPAFRIILMDLAFPEQPFAHRD